LIFNIYQKIAGIPYSLGVWDCLRLGKYLSDEIYGIGRFPDVIDKFSDLNELESSDAIAKFLPDYCTKTNQLTNGCLVVIKIKNRNNLASYYDGYLFYMGEYACYSEVKRFGNYIESVWVI
jgi:hypothetical protein